MMAKSHYIFIPLGCLLLAACGGKADDDAQLNALDNELASVDDGSPTRDPQLREALAGQIMVDPGLTQSSNANAVRPPNRPASDQLPSMPPPADPVDARTLKSAPVAARDCPECRASVGAFTLAAKAGQSPAQAFSDVIGNPAALAAMFANGGNVDPAEALPAAQQIYGAFQNWQQEQARSPQPQSSA